MVREAMKAKGVTVRDIARELDLSVFDVISRLYGDEKFTKEEALHIAEHFFSGFTLEFLFWERGEKSIRELNSGPRGSGEASHLSVAAQLRRLKGDEALSEMKTGKSGNEIRDAISNVQQALKNSPGAAGVVSGYNPAENTCDGVVGGNADALPIVFRDVLTRLRNKLLLMAPKEDVDALLRSAAKKLES